MSEYKVLDLYCSAGGVGLALDKLGYDSIGVDIEDYSEKYCQTFVQADASDLGSLLVALREYIGVRGSKFDLVWASPPCLAYTTLNQVNASRYNWDETPKERYPTIPELNVRKVCKALGKEYIIENVGGCDDLHEPTEINGFGVGIDSLRNTHLFETSFSCPDAVSTGVAEHVTGSIMEHRENLATVKGLPESWTEQEINSGIPKPYVQHLLHYCPTFDGVESVDGTTQLKLTDVTA